MKKILLSLLFPMIACAASFQTKPYDDLKKGDIVVTNVSFAGLATNAGASGAGYYVMSNGVWVAYDPSSSTVDDVARSNAAAAQITADAANATGAMHTAQIAALNTHAAGQTNVNNAVAYGMGALTGAVNAGASTTATHTAQVAVLGAHAAGQTNINNDVAAGMSSLTGAVNAANSTGATHTAQIAVLNAHASGQTNVNAAVASGMEALTNRPYVISVNGQTGAVTVTAALPTGYIVATNQGVAGQAFFFSQGSPSGVSSGYFATVVGSGDMLKSEYDAGGAKQVAFTNDQRIVLALTNAAAFDPAGTAGVVMAALTVHTNRTDNPHAVTAAQVGAAPVFHVKNYGAMGDGVTDDSDAFSNCIAAAMSVSGVVYIDTPSSGDTYLLKRPIVLPIVGTYYQRSIRITSDIGQQVGGSYGAQANVVFALTNSAPACIQSFGTGYLEIDHVSFKSSPAGGHIAPLVFITGTVLSFHDNGFMYTDNDVRQWPDAIILGNTNNATGETPGTLYSSFQGYGTQIYNNRFYKIGHVVLAQTYANSVNVYNNTVNLGNGDCAFKISGGALQGDTYHDFAVNILNNLIEMHGGYEYGSILTNAHGCLLSGNGYWDPAESTKAGVLLTSSATGNRVIDWFNGSWLGEGYTYRPLVVDISGSNIVVSDFTVSAPNVVASNLVANSLSLQSFSTDYLEASCIVGMSNGIKYSIFGEHNVTNGGVITYSMRSDPTPGVYLDGSGNGNTGVQNTPANQPWTTNIGGYAAYGLDNTHHFSTSNSASLNVSNAMTVSFWINLPEFQNYYNVVTKFNDNQWTNGWQVMTRANKIYFDIAPTSGGNPGVWLSAFTVGAWHMVTWTVDSGSGKLNGYTDGAFDQSTSFTGTLRTNAAPLIFGPGAGAPGATYSMRDFRLYNRVLSSSEIVTLYEYGRSVLYSAPGSASTSDFDLHTNLTLASGVHGGIPTFVVTNYSATPFDAAVTITNTSAMTVTSYFGHAYSRTFTSTGTITHVFLGNNATAGNELYMETTATGLPSRVWPAGYVFGYAGGISSNAPSPSPWAQMSVQKTPMGSIVWCVTGQVWQAGTP